MSKKILILTSQKSGGGHRSSSNAIKTAILELCDDVDVKDVDSMEFFPGYTGEETSYNSFTSRYRVLWKLFFEFTSIFYGISNYFLYKTIYKRFTKLIDEYRPDIILSVNPCFVGSIKMSLKKMDLDIPFYVCILDLVKHSRLWWEKKGAITFVPTSQMYSYLLEKGFKKDCLVHSGFPINEKFNNISRKNRTEIVIPNVLMVNPSMRGNKACVKLINAVLKHKVNFTVVTGNNSRLKKYLDDKFNTDKKITILGYCRDMDKRLSDADVLITKAGPNMILEAVKMCVPVLITGHILGQEEKNYKYIVDNGYGLKCESPDKLDNALKKLFQNDFKLLKEISLNQQSCTDVGGAKVVAEYLLKALE